MSHLFAVAFAIIFAQCIITAHSQCSGSCINVNTQRCNGQILIGRCPGASNIRCCVPRNGGGNNGGGAPIRPNNGGGNNGGNNGGGAPIRNNGGNAGNGNANGDLGSYPTSLTTNGYTYSGRNAQALHFLRARFGANPTTYASHSDGPTHSADLWTAGASGGRDTRNLPAMNSLAEYCASNTRSLGLKYVIWRQRINSGSGWRNMADRGGITANHYDHVHITFSGSSCSGKNCARARATDPGTQSLSSTSTTSAADATPSWVIAVIALTTLTAVGTIVVIVFLVRTMRHAAN